MHKVVENRRHQNRIPLMEANEVSVNFLEEMILYFKRKKYDIISLDELPDRLINSKNYKNKFVVFTFDDGYKDNLTLALPIFEKHEVPFTVYLTNCFPNYTAQLLWYMLEDILLENDSVEVSLSDKKLSYTTTTPKEKEVAFEAIRNAFIGMSLHAQQRYIPEFGKQYHKDMNEYVRKESLNWNEVQLLATHPLVTIGGHTMNHVTLNQLSSEVALTEILESKKEIETKTQSEVVHFAYPFGTPNEVNEPEIKLVEESNAFKTATTTRMGNIFKEHKNALHTLPRIQILGNQQKISVLKLYLCGFLPALKNKFKRIITI